MLFPCKYLLLLAVFLILHAEAATTTGGGSTPTTAGEQGSTTTADVFEFVTYSTPFSRKVNPALSRREQQRQQKLARRAQKRRSNRERNRRQREEHRRQRQLRGRRGGAGISTEVGPQTVALSWVAGNLSALWQTVRRLENSLEDVVQKNNLSFFGDVATMSVECELEGTDLSNCPLDDAPCRASVLAEPCSGVGACCCGHCQCHEQYSGDYCECNDEGCDRHEGKECGGRGRCACGLCYCNPGFEGEACECSTSTDTCTDPHNSLICNNYGLCQCGECKCQNGNFGQYCEETTYSAGLCEELKSCVLCNALGKTMPQCSMCTHVTVQRVQNMEPSRKMCRMIHSGCLLQYSYQRAAEGRYDVMVPENLKC